MAAKVITGNRGGKVLIFDGYKYQKNRQRNESIYWRCWRIECRANLKTNIFDINDPQAIIRIFEHNEHTHESDDTSIYRSETLNALKDAIMEDPTVPIKRVYDRVSRVMNRGGGDRERIPEFHRVRTSMTRARLEQVPAVPHTVDDVSILGGWRETWAGDTFFLHQDNDWGILMFATDEELKCLQKCSEVYIDGTFRTCPRPYEQYVTIHGKYRNRVLCFVNCLMTGRQVGQYRQVLQSVKTQVRRASGHRFHRQWNTSVAVRHPSLWTFIRCMKDQQGSVETSIDAANRGDNPPKRRRKWREMENRLQRLKQEYMNGTRNLMDYWDAVCHCVVIF
ncbi:Hypothetical predicted protein [Mytilus galloprovincialis]|uniref:FLYWCH-type domain-containing protein n=1 Tax=Mytilus galloprovincialis TaxID=29158 RepID=A0A8B6DWB6_MYTGA|nr:Hypothetical predicted protein [Mytilus galloprovincialis]